MFHQHTGTQLIPPEPHFRWRGGEITRLEAFTDAVFAFALTLLVVSLEVPRTFSQLALTMKGFLAFAFCFGLLAHLWHTHYRYSRRYGLQTPYVVFMNSVLLFVILFYVYPLKFLFTLTIGGLSGANATLEARPIEIHQVSALMVVFSLGYMAVFAVFALLYRYAYGKRKELELNEYEAVRTRNAMIDYTVVAGVGLLVAVTASLLPARTAFLSIFLLCLSPVYRLVSKPVQRRQEQSALERVQAVERAAAVTLP